MSDRDEESKGVKIVDRRRFDSDGNERSGGLSERGALQPPRSAPASSKAPVSPKDGPTARLSSASGEKISAHPSPTSADSDDFHNVDITFSSFVMSLATQALMQLGEVASPPGVELPIDREAAKQTIDILGMLQRKFSGGLEHEEVQLLEDILHNLRMAYVKRVA